MRSRPSGRKVDEFRDIHGAIGGGRVLDRNGRRAVALRIDVGEIHAGVRRRRLRRENQPAPIRREAVPRVHYRLIAAQRTRHAASHRNDIELAVGRINRPVLFSTKTIHLPSGETLGKSLLMPFSEAPAIRSGGSAFAIVERDAIEVVLDLGFVRIVGEFGRPSALDSMDLRASGPGEHQEFPIGTPERAPSARIAGCRRRAEAAALPVSRLYHARMPRVGIEDLSESEVAVRALVKAIFHAAPVRAGNFDGGDHVFRVRRDLRHESEAFGRALLGESAPADHVFVFDREVTFWIGTSPYNALSFCGPSTSMPSVFPSRETEWQLAHVGRFSIITLLLVSETYAQAPFDHRKHGIRQGLDDAPLTRLQGCGGISGTSR